jgi:hypothetical protein
MEKDCKKALVAEKTATLGPVYRHYRVIGFV